MRQTHVHDLLLLLRQRGDELAQLGHDFIFNQAVLDARSVMGQRLKNVELIRGTHHAALAVPTEVVNGSVVCNAHHPRAKLPFLHIAARLQDLDHLDPDVLKQIVGDFFVAHHKVDLGEDPLLVAVQQCFECAILAISVGADQFAVCEGCMHDTTLYFTPVRRGDPESRLHEMELESNVSNGNALKVVHMNKT